MSHRRSFVVGVMLGAIATGCGDGSRAGAPPPPPVVKVEAVVQRDVPISAEWVGSLVGYINAQIRARVAGHLMSQTYTEGSVVKAGDLADPKGWAQKAILNVAASGKFASDRTIAEYAAEIWDAKPCPVR